MQSRKQKGLLLDVCSMSERKHARWNQGAYIWGTRGDGEENGLLWMHKFGTVEASETADVYWGKWRRAARAGIYAGGPPKTEIFAKGCRHPAGFF